MPVTTRTQDDHPIFNLRRVVLRDHKSRTRISIPIAEEFRTTQEFSQASKVKSSSKDPLSEQSLKALRNVRAALKECHQYDSKPRFKASPSRSSDSTEEEKEEKSWVWSDSSLEVETDSSSSRSSSSEKPEKKSSSKSFEEENPEEKSSSSSEEKSSSSKSSSSSEEEAEEEVVLGDKYKSFPREWLVSFQRDYPKTGLPVVPDKLENP